MKKTFLFLSILAVTFPLFASATSGACSYHGGVNCAAGPAVDGGAICNDGTESSVSYYSMEECTGAETMQPTLSGCTLQSEVDTLKNLVQQQESANQAYVAEVQESEVSTGSEGGSAVSNAISEGSEELANLQSQETLCQSQVDAYNAPARAESACAEKDPNSYYDSTSNQCVCSSGYLFDTKDSLCETQTTYCTTNYGQYAEAGSSPSTCGCQQGYEFLDNHSACVSYSSYCDVKYGQNAIANSDGTCSVSCPAGATYNSSTQVCVMQVAVPVVPTPEQTQLSVSPQTLQIQPISTQINPVVPHHTAMVRGTSIPLPSNINPIDAVVAATTSSIDSTTTVIATSIATTASANAPIVPTPKVSFLSVLENLIGRLNPFSWF